jgi:CheY-like chemotaxis protein
LITIVDLRMKALVVDDSKAYINFITSILENYNCQIFTANDGHTGLQQYKLVKPDIIFCDIEMPVMNGIEMLKKLRVKDRNVIIIMMTGNSKEKYVLEALNSGASNYFKKDDLKKELPIIVEKYLTVIFEQKKPKEFTDQIESGSIDFVFDNRIENLASISLYLASLTRGVLSNEKRSQITIGLQELLMNAVEHGNLNITYREKTDALENNCLEELYNERLTQQNLESRRVRVNFQRVPELVEWSITDEGDGFDISSIPDPCDVVNLDEMHGRGILISKYQFDELKYSNNGKTVWVMKNASKRD